MDSCVLTGSVRHRRYRTKAHSFRYSVFMVLVDLERVEDLFDFGRFWSTRPSLVRFRRQDYLPGKPNLAEEVRSTVEAATGQIPSGRICLLTNPRIFGYLINPISIFYCFSSTDCQQESVQYIVLEVVSTPWKERCRYVLACDPLARNQRIRFRKKMHVSPFLPMDMTYVLRANQPANQVAVHLQNWEQERLALDATLALKSAGNTNRVRLKVIAAYPWMTAKVYFVIHWQALRLFLKRIPVVLRTSAKSESLR